MTVDYSSLLSDEQKRSILEQRLTQFAAEAYQHQINKEVAILTENPEGISSADNALEILTKAIQVHQNELAKLAD